jgi:hypothetical protein
MNVNKLKGKIVENGFTVGSFAESIGMDRSTLYRKMNKNGDTFTIKEVKIICCKLELTDDEALAIFFSQCVA